MAYIDLMFATRQGHDRWLEEESDWKQAWIDLNLPDIVRHIKKSDEDFCGEYLEKPCIREEDADYRLETMYEIYADESLYNSLAEYNKLLKKLHRDIFEWSREEFPQQKQYRFTRLVCFYFELIERLKEITLQCKSSGLVNLHDYCERITRSEKFKSIKAEAAQILSQTVTVLRNNALVINPADKVFTFEKRDPELDLSELFKNSVLDVFGIELENRFSIVDPAPLSNIEEKALRLIMAKNGEIFQRLDYFCNKSSDFHEYIEVLAELRPQLAFYLGYAGFVKTAAQGGIPVCRPVFRDEAYEALDCANPSLVAKFIDIRLPLRDIVRNDIELPRGGMFILSGPNQGGKTIYLKTVGLTAYLARCGCLVFSRRCAVPFYDMIYTHFMQKEVPGKGRLVEETERMEKMMCNISRNTLVLLNESFASTRRKDGMEIAMHYLSRFEKAGCSVGFVSHYYEIPEIYKDGNNRIVSLSGGIDDEGKRTYKILKVKGSGLAYARDIAKKCGMTYEQIRDEIAGWRS